jgi:dolichol kinase
MTNIEVKRQMIHAGGIFVILFILFGGRLVSLLLTAFVTMSFVVWSEYRKRRTRFKKIYLFKNTWFDKFENYIERHVKGYERPFEYFKGPIMYFGGCFFTILFFPETAAIAGIVVLALADSTATIIGKLYGTHLLPINRKSSWEGSLAFFLVTLIIISYFNPVKALLIAVVTTFVEMLPKINDNISVPLTVAFLFTI